MANNTMISCPACGQPMAANAKACPHCGAKNKKPFYKKWWFWAIIILLLAAAGSAGSGSSHSGGSAAGSNAPAQPAATATPDFSLQGEVTVTSDSFSTYYEGIIVNNRNRDYAYVQVTFTLYDADGNQLGTALDNINDLKANGTWKFKAAALCDDDDIATWELTSIEGF